MGVRKGTISGKLISRLSAIGTLSEGPIYFILPTGEYSKWKEIPVRKKVMRWMKDRILHDLVGEIISINGEIIETKDTITIDYDEVVHNGKVIPALKQNSKVVLSPEEVDAGFMKLYGKKLHGKETK
ncbi:MAG: hypothetical protein ACTSVZ_05990 [Promethearchaeota archaeon]